MNKLISLFAGLILVVSQYAGASFAEKNKRYLSTKDMFTLLTQKFPLLSNPNSVQTLKPSCWVIGSNNTNVTGLVNPAVGSPATTQPSAGFVRWWGSCAELIIKDQFTVLKNNPTFEKLWQRYWAPAVLDQLRDKSNVADPFHQLQEIEWKKVSNRTKDAQIRYLIEEFIGPNPVIRDLGFVKGTDELIGILKDTLDPNSTMTFSDANQKLILATLLREEFLTY